MGMSSPDLTPARGGRGVVEVVPRALTAGRTPYTIHSRLQSHYFWSSDTE